MSKDQIIHEIVRRIVASADIPARFASGPFFLTFEPQDFAAISRDAGCKGYELTGFAAIIDQFRVHQREICLVKTQHERLEWAGRRAAAEGKVA